MEHSNNILDLLWAEHRKLTRQCSALSGARNDREYLFRFTDLKTELMSHLEAEESLLYPVFCGSEDNERIVNSLYQNHHELRALVQELEDTMDTSHREDLIEDLIAAVAEHRDEEENEFFALVQQILEPSELKELGLRRLELKEGVAEAA